MKSNLFTAFWIAFASLGARADLLYTIDESTDSLATIDTVTGAFTVIGPLGVPVDFGDIAFDSARGVMYMVDGWGAGLSTPSSLYTVDLSTGAATLVGSTGATSLFSLVYDPLGDRLYAGVSTSNPTGFYALDRTSGAATLIGDPSVGLDGMTFVASTNSVVGLFAGPGSLHSIDTATGVSSLITVGGGFVNNCGIAWSSSSNTVYAIDWSGDLYAFDVGASYARTTLFSGLNPCDGLAAAGPSCPSPSVYCTAGTTSSGCIPAIAASGPLSVAASSGTVVSATGVEGQRAGALIYGTNGGVAFPWGSGSTSYFCIRAPVQRTLQQLSGGTVGQCNGSFSLDLRAFLAANPTALGNPLSAGAQFSVQWWFRDPPAPRSTNLSDAITITACP